MKVESLIQDLKKLLDVMFDNQLNFNHHISKICKKPVTNFMHFMHSTLMKMKGEYFSIRTFHLNLITVPSYGRITTNQ